MRHTNSVFLLPIKPFIYGFIFLNYWFIELSRKSGGEEFLFIFPQTNDSDAHIITENLRKIIEEHNFYNNIKVTASFGINECKDDNPTKCVSKADKALYKAKNSNRNCVKVFSENKCWLSK